MLLVLLSVDVSVSIYRDTYCIALHITRYVSYDSLIVPALVIIQKKKCNMLLTIYVSQGYSLASAFENNVSLLGINIDFMLKFDDHVTEICKKASKQLAVLKRLGRFLTKQGKLVMYNSYIQVASNFSYCPLAWHFCSIASTNKLEKVQERALRFINNNYSSSLKKLLNQTKTEPLHVKKLKLMACEVLKIVNKLSPEYIQDMISIKTSTYNFRGERKAEIPKVNTTRYGLRSFRSEAPRIWNSLPNNLRVAESYPQFQGLLRKWDSLGCGCPLCCA